MLFRYIKLAAAAFGILIIIWLAYYGFTSKQPIKVPARSDVQSQATPTPGTGNQVVYVFDQDLIRFGKFALAVLAVFVAVGAFFYGFDIKQAAKEVRDSADKMRQISYDVNKARDDIDAAQAKSQQLLSRAQELLSTAGEYIRNKESEIEKLLQQSKEGAQTITLISAQLRTAPTLPAAEEADDATVSPGFSVVELKRLYNIPPQLSGVGQCIGLIELGGGYRQSDLEKYFQRLNIESPPAVFSVSVDGARNAPSRSEGGPDGQVTLDIEVAGAMAPGARIVVYFGANTDRGFLNVIEHAITDEKNRPSILSISWGGPETTWSGQAMKTMNSALQKAAALGITVVAAAGDGGANDGGGNELRVDFPASSPWVLACGGTRLHQNRSVSEEVWNDGPDSGATGGGFSGTFPRPAWQSKINVLQRRGETLTRGIPDVAANASPASGYRIFLRGKEVIMGGTSAAAPFWAGLIALLNEGLKQNLGYWNPLLYQKIGPAEIFRSITQGNNSSDSVEGYSASGPNWSPTVGWGSPDGEKLFRALKEHLVSIRKEAARA